ncbi:MarR family winged helix-turn-helix transcriptional regulator [Actinokineospora globicatena]|uniref:MarR family transcriptional regulator n=1 Tax=Actinokineospora globicatena TaxID=103729 RepID=A0A9W6QP80_9PSEU|nr:MarR family winged helix-turn-helix transcriptional regulator [Actinokineospora globicatena]GLW92152.1 MarR family transcriptional regulator [Actinokineospora globicatena]
MDAVSQVERAMVAIRRLQTRRTLAGPHDPTLTLVVDALEATGPCTITELATALAVDQPRASRLAARAVTEGLAHRHPAPTDARRAVLSLTPAGQAHAATIHAMRQEVFARTMSTWPTEARDTFATLLTAFVDSYTEVIRERAEH